MASVLHFSLVTSYRVKYSPSFPYVTAHFFISFKAPHPEMLAYPWGSVLSYLCSPWVISILSNWTSVHSEYHTRLCLRRSTHMHLILSLDLMGISTCNFHKDPNLRPQYPFHTRSHSLLSCVPYDCERKHCLSHTLSSKISSHNQLITKSWLFFSLSFKSPYSLPKLIAINLFNSLFIFSPRIMQFLHGFSEQKPSDRSGLPH